MTKTPRKVGNWLAKLLVGLSLCFLAYDLLTPIYSKVAFTDVKRIETGITANVRFTKERDCSPITGTVVAFVYFGDDYRLPANILNSEGQVLVLKNFPPSKTPVSVRLTWVAAPELPNPTAISMGFYLKCRTRIPQHIEWYSEVTIKS